MNPNFLDFEQPIADLEAKIQELRHASQGPAVNIEEEVRRLEQKLRDRTIEIFRDLSAWQVSQLARHPARPYTNDYIRLICDEFHELAGDRAYADDAAIVGGLARIAGRPMIVGDTMEFEFGIFIAATDPADPGAIEGRTAYYTDTFRYRVGRGGLHPHNEDPSGVLGPAPEDTLAGCTTIPHLQQELEFSFSQMALDMQPEHVQPFLQGRRLFHTDFGTGEHGEPGNPVFDAHIGKLGPLFNVASCDACHVHNGRSAPHEPGEVLLTTAIKLYDHATFGDQLQPQEAEIVLDRWEVAEVVELADGTEVELVRPVYAGAETDWAYSPRVARQLTGLGLLEAIDEAQILARAKVEGCDGTGGINGRAMLISDPTDGAVRVGRFGWKAEKVSVRHQIADALIQDMGVTTSLFDGGDAPELSDEELDELVAYVSLLGLPGRRNADDPQVMRGEVLFGTTGCDGCHVREAFTADTHPFVELRDQEIRPFSDLLVHDMGEGLADPQGGPLAREWRTAPLWGLGLLEQVSGHIRLLHDGRARTMLEAILWHGGEATFASAAVRQMGPADREALLAYLGSL